MKYNVIEITRGMDESNPWIVKFDDSDTLDREPEKRGKYIPCVLGFFHYPRKWGAKRAFEVLKEDMVKRCQVYIECLQTDIEMIQKLELPDWVEPD